MIWIKDFKEGDRIGESFLVINVTKATTTTNVPFLTITLQDKTGTIEGKFWDIKPDLETMIQPGVFLQVRGDVLMYRQMMQLKIDQVKLLNPDSLDISDFTITAPIPLPKMEATLKEKIASIMDPDYNKLVSSLIEDHYQAFIVFPAATRNHHAYTSGLLYHTLSMIDIAEFFISKYPPINRDLLISGILLHDLAKTRELSSPIITKYTLEGKLLGHIHMMASEIYAKAKQLNTPEQHTILLQHLILSHHGKPEFGSAIQPFTKEALLLHMIDDFDAKMTMIDKALEGVEAGTFTPRLFTFDDRSFYKPE